MSNVTVTAGPCSAKIRAAITQFGPTDTNNLQSDAKEFLRVSVSAPNAYSAANLLNNLHVTQQFGGGLPGGVSANPGTLSKAGIDMSAWEGKFSDAAEIGSALDKMESEAMQLMKSPKKEDQIKGQQMMQAVTQIMEAIIKAIQARGDAAKHAIQASESR